MNATGRLASWWPTDPGGSEDLARALSFLGWEVAAGTVVAAGNTAGVLTASAGLLLALLVPGQTVLVAAGGLGVGLVVVHVVHAGPTVLATARRTRALGAAPDLVARATLRMRVEPTPERAAAFAARTGRGPLADRLGAHVVATRDGSGLASFGTEWEEWSPALERALALLDGAGRVDAADRERVLDRALRTVLDGVRRQAREYASAIGGAVTALYAFGVLLPTALVALLPAARAAGVPVTLTALVLVYDLLVPGCLLAGGAWILARRPVAFPPAEVPADHPAVPRRPWRALATGAVCAAVAWSLAALTLPPWAPPVTAAGVGVGVGLRVHYREHRRVQRRVDKAEAGLSDAMTLLGQRIAGGESPEAALTATASTVGGETGALLAAGAARARSGRWTLGTAFTGPDGLLATLPSRRLRGACSFVAVAAREGRPAGAALLSLADHIEALERVEAEARADLDRVCATLSNTGATFGPLVAGATVALSETIGASESLSTATTPALGAVIGVYVLVLAGLLVALATGLRRGFERALVGHAVGRALVLAACLYPVTAVVVGTLT